jgi:hypothetical protein
VEARNNLTEPGVLAGEVGDNQGMLWRRIGEETLIHDRGARRLCFLNATASCVWEMVSAGRSTDEIVAAICGAYAGTDEGQVRTDVEDCRAELKRLGLTRDP